MKKIFAVVLILVLFSGVSAAAYADGASDRLGAFKNFYDTDEMTTVIKQTRNDSLLRSSGHAELKAHYGDNTTEYKEYDAIYPDFLDRLENGAAVGELISDEYTWVFSQGYVKTEVSLNDKGEWQTGQIATAPKELIEKGEVADGFVRLDQVNAAIKQIGGSNVKDVICVNLPRKYAKFVCLVSDTTFVIPFTPRPDFTGFENGKMYTASEANEIWKKYIDSLPVCNNAEILNGHSIDELTAEELLSLEYWGTGERTVTQTESSSVAKNGIPLAVVLIIPAVSIGAAIAIMMLVWDRRGKKHGK